MHLKFVASFLVAMALLLASSQARAQVDAGTAESLMRSSGLWQQLEPLAPQVRSEFLAALEKAGARPSPGEVQRLGQVITSAYAADRLRASALCVFKSELNAQHVPALKQWHASRDGRTIGGMEEAAFASLAIARFAKAYDELPTDELVRYVEFLKTPAGQHFTDVGLKAYGTAMVAASTDMGRGLPGTKDKANS